MQVATWSRSSPSGGGPAGRGQAGYRSSWSAAVRWLRRCRMSTSTSAGGGGCRVESRRAGNLTRCRHRSRHCPRSSRLSPGAVSVYVNGGIRHGTDVVTALALGAQKVMVGQADRVRMGTGRRRRGRSARRPRTSTRRTQSRACPPRLLLTPGGTHRAHRSRGHVVIKPRLRTPAPARRRRFQLSPVLAWLLARAAARPAPGLVVAPTGPRAPNIAWGPFLCLTWSGGGSSLNGCRCGLPSSRGA
jgi:hypothetical protein